MSHAHSCSYCPALSFKGTQEFAWHLREHHCTREGGSFTCRYGSNGVCTLLPMEGVSDQDYEEHVNRHHLGGTGSGNPWGLPRAKKQGSPDGVALPHHYPHPENSQQHPPNVVPESEKWSVYSSSQNLPAVLNDPNKGKQRDFFTKTWGDYFVEPATVPKSAVLPEVCRESFETYLKRTSRRYKKLQKRKSSLPQKSQQNDLLQLFPNLQATRSLEQGQAALSSIPQVFLQESLRLEDAATFMAVLPVTELGLGRRNSSTSSHSTMLIMKTGTSAKLLQEKLTHHLDVVEVAIAQQVAHKAQAFFKAVSSHDALHEQLRQTIEAVRLLRCKVGQIDSTLVRGSLHLLRLQIRQRNQQAVFNKLRLMATVQQTQPNIQLLLSTSDYVGALDLMSTTQDVLSLELAGAHAFRHLGSQLAELGRIVQKMLRAEFQRHATADLNRPLAENDSVLEEEKLVAIVFGMLRQRTFTFVDDYRDEACTAVKAVVKQTVVEAVSPLDSIDTEGPVTSLMDQLRLLEFPEWLQLLQQTHQNLLMLLKRVKAVVGVMQDAVDIAAGKARPTSSLGMRERAQECPQVTTMQVPLSPSAEDVLLPDSEHVDLSLRLRDLLQCVCDCAHERSARLVTTRSRDGFLERLTCQQFVELWRCVESFVEEGRGVSGCRSTALQLALQGQVSKFVQRFHEERKAKLALLLEAERWKQADVPAEFQELVDFMNNTGKLQLPHRFSGSESPDAKKPPAPSLTLDEEEFAVVGTALLVLKMVVEYCEAAGLLGVAVPDLLLRLSELLKLFNSRCCQLVLGAGALHQVGLKTITSTNLALASRSLQLLLHLMPKVHDHFQGLLEATHPPSPTQTQKVLPHIHPHGLLLRSLLSVQQDFKDHVAEIETKLLGIITSLLDQQISKWEVKPPVPSVCFRAITRQVGKLHEALGTVLPPQQVAALFERLHQALRDLLRAQLTKLKVVSDGGPQHGVVISELTFYLETVRGLNVLPAETLDASFMQEVWAR